MFNKRHYEAIALTIQRIPNDCRYGVAERFADLFGRDNDRFSRARFMAACEPNANVKLRTRYKILGPPNAHLGD